MSNRKSERYSQKRLEHCKGEATRKVKNDYTEWQKGQQTVKQDYSMAKGATDSQRRLQHNKKGQQTVKQDYGMEKGPTDSHKSRQ